MNVAVWIVSGVLAAANLAAGTMKSTRPISALRETMAWVDDLAPQVVRMIGVLELLSALGLILPKLTGVVDPRAGVDGTLSGLAASGIVLIQVLAVPVHLRRGEKDVIGINVVFALMAAFVAAARFGWL